MLSNLEKMLGILDFGDSKEGMTIKFTEYDDEYIINGHHYCMISKDEMDGELEQQIKEEINELLSSLPLWVIDNISMNSINNMIYDKKKELLTDYQSYVKIYCNILRNLKPNVGNIHFGNDNLVYERTM